jgi:type IV pilus assembly protein PilY1
MRKRFIRSFPALAAAALALASGTARAQQIDTNPPLPNVLLLIDNSGSMEYMISGQTPEASGNSCNCTDNGPGQPPTCSSWSNVNATTPSPNRWGIVQTAMTGSLQNGFNCVAMPRTSGSTFDGEYKINGKSTYDTGYYLPFHRLVAEDTSGASPVACVVAPGKLPGAAQGSGVGPQGDGANGLSTDFPAGAIVARQYGKLPPIAVACSGQTNGAVVGFPQYPDGALTTMRDLMRFGMMTFDSDTDPSTGVSTSDTLGSPPFQGMWTYFPNWTTNPTGTIYPYSGDPAGCTTGPQVLAVGARNPGAPPWEGRLVGFPSLPDLNSQRSNNDEVSNVILASRPYGGTPLAGMFVSAQNYLWTDTTGPQQTDNYVKGMCRSEYIILLTDGAPNLDLEIYPPTAQNQLPVADCSAVAGADGGGGGKCPFPLPQDTAKTLYANGNSSATQASVKTYVIGFAVSNFIDGTTPANCSQFATNGALASQCDCTDHTLAAKPGIGACCVLQCVARNGGTNAAYFADNQGDLQNALGAILADIAKNTTTRTTPAYSPVISNVLGSTSGPQQTNESIFLASFNPSPGQPWSGDLQRQRYVCTYSGSGFTIPAPTVQTAQGDDFAVNLNSGNGPARTFIAFQPATVAGVTDATTTIRPYAPTSGGDGVGQYKATVYSGAAAPLDTEITYQAMNLKLPGCTYTSTVNGAQKTITPADCATMLLDYTFGVPFSANGSYSDFKFVSRVGNAFGSIYHATPQVVGPPGTLLQDPGYVGFAASGSNGWGARKTVVYVATNDGLLHAFWSDETQLENNELWAMLLPAPMANLNGGSYPSSSALLLDGSPVVKDVVWDRGVSGSGSTLADSDPTAWHTMLVAGYGASQTGYYAVDVTNPDPTGMTNGANPPNDPPQVGPVFRWQLTKMPQSNMPLFGSHSATPAVTTLYLDPGDGNGAREIGVAILPGGQDVVPSTQAECARITKSSDSAPLTSYSYRTNVRCWGNPTGGAAQKSTDVVIGRSVSIVRLDTGEILRVFARKTDFQNALYASDTVNIANRYTDVALDSPMVGTPVVYPSDVGTDTTKFFMTDADGTVWRFDVSSSDPSNWFGELYLDMYNQTVDTSSTAWSDGQPAQVPPVLSLDPSGNVVLNIATGTTDQFDTTGVEYVYSVTEKIAQGLTPKLRATVNWWMQPSVINSSPGERVSGPMTVFNGTLYFSTYAAAPPGTQSCNAGTARLWGRDFVTPDDTTCASNPTGCDRSLGGLREMQPPAPNAPTSPPPVYVEPDIYDSTLQGKVIPGVSIKATPACADLGTPGNDSYVAGASHASPQDYSSGGYSLFTQVGAKGTNGATTRQFETSVPTPVSPTLIDSWAAVLE